MNRSRIKQKTVVTLWGKKRVTAVSPPILLVWIWHRPLQELVL